MRTYFRVVINVSSETSRTVIDQGLNDFDSLVEFTEVDMKTLCTTIRRPSGMIINPRANISDQPPTMCDPGHLVSMIANKLLLMTDYAEMHQACTSRPIDPHREQELAYSKPLAIDKPLRDTSMSKWLE